MGFIQDRVDAALARALNKRLDKSLEKFDESVEQTIELSKAGSMAAYGIDTPRPPYGSDTVRGKPHMRLAPQNIPGPGWVTPIDQTVPFANEYQVGYNYQWRPRSGYSVTFPMLRALARNCELVRMAVQMRKDQVRGLDWDITVRPGYDPRALEPARQRMRAFFQNPDTLNDLDFNDFLSRFLEDLLVLDAGCIAFHKDRAQRIYGMTSIDGATIKPFLDQYAFSPMPPDPAYGQVLFGRIVGTFTRDELLYCMYNPLADQVYGMSPVEMVITTAHISLRRQLFHLGYYTDGNIPDYIIPAPAEWGSDQIRQVQEYLDSYLTGNNAARHKMKLIPAGLQPKELRQVDFTTQVDEWLARIVGAIFGVAPFLLLKSKEAGSRASLQTISEQQADIGLKPLQKYLAETFTTRILQRRFKQYGLQFTWLSEQRLEAELNLARAKSLIPVGAIGIDEMRVAEGKPPIGIPPYIMTPAGGILFLTPKVIGAVNDGTLDFISPKDGGMDITSGLIPGGASGAAGVPLTIPEWSSPDAPVESQENDAMETEVVESYDEADEMEKWARLEMTAFRRTGRPASNLSTIFFDAIDKDRAARIINGLNSAETARDVQGCFAREGVRWT